MYWVSSLTSLLTHFNSLEVTSRVTIVFLGVFFRRFQIKFAWLETYFCVLEDGRVFFFLIYFILFYFILCIYLFRFLPYIQIISFLGTLNKRNYFHHFSDRTKIVSRYSLLTLSECNYMFIHSLMLLWFKKECNLTCYDSRQF